MRIPAADEHPLLDLTKRHLLEPGNCVGRSDSRSPAGSEGHEGYDRKEAQAGRWRHIRRCCMVCAVKRLRQLLLLHIALIDTGLAEIVTGRLKYRHEWARQMPPVFGVMLYLVWSVLGKYDVPGGAGKLSRRPWSAVRAQPSPFGG